jgi:hypothetical protein
MVFCFTWAALVSLGTLRANGTDQFGATVTHVCGNETEVMGPTVPRLEEQRDFVWPAAVLAAGGGPTSRPDAP